MKTLHKILIGLGAIVFASVLTFSAHAFSSSWQPQATLEKADNLKLQEAMVVDFSFPVLKAEVEKNISISPQVPVSFSWEDGNKKLIITPQRRWSAGMDYNISIKGKSIFYTSFDSKFSFSTEKQPTIVSMVPISGEKNVAVDMQDPIIVNFDFSLEDWSIKFLVAPNKQLTYDISPDRKTIRLLATDDFKFSTSYDIQVFLKYASDDQNSFQKVGETSFVTEAPPLPPAPVSAQWPKDFTARVAYAKQFTPAQIATGKYIDVNLREQVMVIFQDSQPLDSYMVSSGERGLETPTGTFQIYNKSPRAWSAKYGLWMPWWMAFLPSGEMGIHELPVWPGGYQEGAAHLGTPVSHGCVRLGVGPAKRVYDWADIGTPVVIHY